MIKAEEIWNRNTLELGGPDRITECPEFVFEPSLEGFRFRCPSGSASLRRAEATPWRPREEGFAHRQLSGDSFSPQITPMDADPEKTAMTRRETRFLINSKFWLLTPGSCVGLNLLNQVLEFGSKIMFC